MKVMGVKEKWERLVGEDNEPHLGSDWSEGSESVHMDTSSREWNGLECEALGKVLDEGLRCGHREWDFQCMWAERGPCPEKGTINRVWGH